MHRLAALSRQHRGEAEGRDQGQGMTPAPAAGLPGWRFKSALLGHFIAARWLLRFRSRRLLLLWQEFRLRRMIRHTLAQAPLYAQLLRDQPGDGPCAPQAPNAAIRAGGDPWAVLAQLPVIDKQRMMADFDQLNTRGVRREQALAVAEQAEVSRDFSPTLGSAHPAWADLSVGLSSGTSGQRGLFVVSDAERARWAGILLGRTLPRALLRQIVSPWRPPLRIAFFLRANSNLYTTLASKRIDFQFFDLLQGLPAAIRRLQGQPPDVLVAPPAALHALAQAQLRGDLGWPTAQPLKHLVSIADVLEPTDSAICVQAFGCAPAQIYQATEGFLGYSCERGGLHLNEAYVLIERAALDTDDGAPASRFQPIITDLSRSTQLMVRYRLNDILRVAPAPCRCGRAELTLQAIEGRSDDWLQIDGTPVAADVFRRAVLMALAVQHSSKASSLEAMPTTAQPSDPVLADALRDYRFIQHDETGALSLALDAPDTQLPALHDAIVASLQALLAQQGLTMPPIASTRLDMQAADRKRRRVLRVTGCEQPPTAGVLPSTQPDTPGSNPEPTR